MTKKTTDAISGAVILLVAVAMYLNLPGPGETVVAGLDLSLAPRLVAMLLGGLSLLLIVTALVPTGETQAEDEGKEKMPYRGRLIATAMLIVAAAACFEWLGFVVTSAIYIFAQCYILTYERGAFKPVGTAVLAIAFPVAVYLMFWHWLSMPLPSGIL